MITRNLQNHLAKLIRQFPAVAILGPRQVGKTTLAKALSKGLKKDMVYLDLENPRDTDRLRDPFTFLEDRKKSLILIDEIQRMPELFTMLRPLIDAHRKPARFILTGSSSPELMKGVSESLAGRIHYAELFPIGLNELPDNITMKNHWFKGGFPKALLNKGKDISHIWLDDFIKTYIERDLSLIFGVEFTKTAMRNFWRMLAHGNGNIWNAESYARSLGLTAPTVARYLEFLEAAFLIHRLPAYYFNAKKRIVKAPKIYWRDSGILHRLSSLNSLHDLEGTTLLGNSWEGYVIEQINQYKLRNMDLYYYRTQNGAEADLVITIASKPVACVEIKYSNVPALSKGFYESVSDLKTTQNFIITPENTPYKHEKTITVCGLREFLKTYLPKLSNKPTK